jgi:hypothetical protein
MALKSKRVTVVDSVTTDEQPMSGSGGSGKRDMGLFRRGNIWWYEFLFTRRRVRESAKTTSKTVAKQAEKNRRRELERGFNGVEDNRDDRVRSIKEMSTAYLEEYCLRHKSVNFATYATQI